MKRIRIAQIGALHDHSADVFETMASLPGIFEIKGYAAPDGKKFADAPLYHGYPERTAEEILSLPDLDAVTIETGEKDLTKYARMAVEKGLAVHMDKPGGTDPEEFRALIDAVEKKGVLFHTGYMYRTNPEVAALKKRVEAGELGRIYSVEAQMNCLHSAEKREWLSQFPGGMMFFLGCHMVDLVLLFQGIPEKVTSYCRSTDFDGVSAEDLGFAVLEYPNGVSFVKCCAAEPGGYLRRQLTVHGEKGSVQLMPLEARFDVSKKANVHEKCTFVRDCTFPGRSWNFDGQKRQSLPFQRYEAMMREFASCVSGEAASPYPPEYEWQVYRTLMQACGVRI